MSKKNVFAAFFVLFLAGCASGRNYQSDLDALNARVSALQGQLAAKDQEIERLSSRVRENESALQDAEAEKRLLTEKLDSAMGQLDKARSQKPAKAASEDSYLK